VPGPWWGAENVIVTSDSDIGLLVGRALDQTAAVIAAIPAGLAGAATPCPGWNERALVRHLIGQDLRNFIVAARSGVAAWQAPAELGEDWAGAFRDRAGQLLAVWQEADLDQLVAMPGGGRAPLRSRADQQITDLAVHGWDLAKATRQQADLDPVLAAGPGTPA